MKKILIMLLGSAILFSLCACSGGKDASGQETSAVSDSTEAAFSVPSEFSFSDYSQTSELSDKDVTDSISDSTEESFSDNTDTEETEPTEESALQESTDTEYILPVGLTKVPSGKLRFTTSVLSLSVTFPEQFHVLNTDYSPLYGIYLRNESGTATLLAESVEDKTLTHKEMAQYLRSKYPDATVTINDKKEVICTMQTQDNSGNSVWLQQKLKMKSGGYNLISLCCHPDEKSKYTPVFHEITFS